MLYKTMQKYKNELLPQNVLEYNQFKNQNHLEKAFEKSFDKNQKMSNLRLHTKNKNYNYASYVCS